MAKRANLYYSYSPVTQELMITTVDPEKLCEVENVMLDSEHYLQVDPKTGETKGIFILFVDPDNVDESFHKFPTPDEVKRIDFKNLFPQLS